MENLAKDGWEIIVLNNSEGEKILFKIGLMTVKASSLQTNNSYMICETVLPPGAYVEPHNHVEAETFYILEGEFTFWVDDMTKLQTLQSGAFVCVPPFVTHSFRNTSENKGKILGSITPGGENGLESLFRIFGYRISNDSDIPDLNLPIEKFFDHFDKLNVKKE